MGTRRALAAVAILTTVGCVALPASSAARQAGPRFGTFVYQEPVNEVEFLRMRVAGARVMRLSLLWFEVQRRKGARFDWRPYDGIVERAARAGLKIVPMMIGSPGYASDHPAEPPTRPVNEKRFARFLRATVDRYGHNGRFWRRNRDVPYRPIKDWEVWNEPNLPSFWTDGKPNPREYFDLLRLSAHAIRGADPRAEVVLAGMPEIGRLRASVFLDRLYRIKGVKRMFDVVALHPYAGSVGAFDRNIRRARRVMNRHGDRRTPISITEMGWASNGQPGHQLVKGRKGQARHLEQSFRLLERRAARYRLRDVIWFRWQDPHGDCTGSPHCWVHYSGLFTGDEEPKPAFRAFARATGGNPLVGPLPPDLLDRLRPHEGR